MEADNEVEKAQQGLHKIFIFLYFKHIKPMSKKNQCQKSLEKVYKTNKISLKPLF